MVNYKSEEVEEKVCETSEDLKSHKKKKKKHSKDRENGNAEKPDAEEKEILEESVCKKNKLKKKCKNGEEISAVDDDDHKEVKLKKSKKHKHQKEEETGSENHKNEEEPKKKKRKHKEEIVAVDEVAVSKEIPDASDDVPKENNDSEKPAKEKRKKKKKQKHMEEENGESEKTEAVPVSEGIPDASSNVESKDNDSEKPADVIKKRKPRHPGREEKKLEKLKKRKLIAEGIIDPEPKIKIKKKRKRKAKKNEKATDSAVKPAENTPRPKGDIPFENESTAEYKAKKYLKLWKKDNKKWKFIKARQIWLVHNMYNPEKINDKKFKTLLKYVAGMKGFSRQTTLEQAKNVLECTDAKVLKKVVLPEKPGEIQMARAREIIQLL